MIDKLSRPSFSAHFTYFTFSSPTETALAVDQLPSYPVFTDFSHAFPDAVPPALLSRDWQPWQPLDKSEILPAADIQALCRAISFDVPDFAAMPPVPYPSNRPPLTLPGFPKQPPKMSPLPASTVRDPLLSVVIPLSPTTSTLPASIVPAPPLRSFALPASLPPPPSISHRWPILCPLLRS